PSGDPPLRNPIIGVVDCCARATNGQRAAALPKRPMKSRRLIDHLLVGWHHIRCCAANRIHPEGQKWVTSCRPATLDKSNLPTAYPSAADLLRRLRPIHA